MKQLALWCAMTAVSCAAWADDDTALGQNSPNETVSGSLNLVTESNKTTVLADNKHLSGSLKNNQADNETVYPYKSSGSLNIPQNQNTAAGANSETVSGSLKGNQENNQANNQ